MIMKMKQYQKMFSGVPLRICNSFNFFHKNLAKECKPSQSDSSDNSNAIKSLSFNHECKNSVYF